MLGHQATVGARLYRASSGDTLGDTVFVTWARWESSVARRRNSLTPTIMFTAASFLWSRTERSPSSDGLYAGSLYARVRLQPHVMQLAVTLVQ